MKHEDSQRFQQYIQMAVDNIRDEKPEVGHSVFFEQDGGALDILELDFDRALVRTSRGWDRWETVTCYIPF